MSFLKKFTAARNPFVKIFKIIAFTFAIIIFIPTLGILSYPILIFLYMHGKNEIAYINAERTLESFMKENHFDVKHVLEGIGSYIIFDTDAEKVLLINGEFLKLLSFYEIDTCETQNVGVSLFGCRFHMVFNTRNIEHPTIKIPSKENSDPDEWFQRVKLILDLRRIK